MAEYIAKGTVLSKSSGGGGSYADIANILSITPPNQQRDALETTKHNDSHRFRTFIPGLVDPGEVSLNVAYDPADATHEFQSELGSATVASYRITFPTTPANTLTFDAFLTSFEPTGEVDGLLTANVTYKVSGQPVLAAVGP